MMKSTKEIDPLTIWRRAHARIFDRPVIVGNAKVEDELLKNMLYESLMEGKPQDFRKWLKRNRPNWQEDELGQYCMGMAYKAERRYKEAKQCYEKALKMREVLGDPLKIALALQELRIIALANGDNETAWYYLDKAMAVKPDLFGTHHNRLCLASIERDCRKLESVYQEMEEYLPEWYRNNEFVDLLRNDATLDYLRNEAKDIWQNIINKIDKDI